MSKSGKTPAKPAKAKSSASQKSGVKPRGKAVTSEIVDVERERGFEDDDLNGSTAGEHDGAFQPEILDASDAPIEFVDINPDEDPIASPENFVNIGTTPAIRKVGSKTNEPETFLAKDGVVHGVLTRDVGHLTDGEDIAPERSLGTVDPIVTYLAELKKYPLLTREQENALAIRYRDHGDARAAETLVTSNLRFVVKVAAEYTKFGAKLIDLVQEGNVGLMHAVREYDPYKNVRLISYAVWWIRGYIQEYLMRQYSMVRIGTTQAQRKLFYRLQKEKDAMDRMGIRPTHQLLSSRLGVTEEEVATMDSRMNRRDVSLDQPITRDGSSAATMLDYEPSSDRAMDDALGTAEEVAILQEHLQAMRGQLNEKELFILENRLLADEPMTLQEIGERFGVTREAVRQVEARLMNRIKEKLTDEI